MSNSPEEKISVPILVWFRDNASSYNFEPDIQFKDVLSDDEFKYLDLDKLWKLVAPHLQNLVEDYLRYYKNGLWDGSAALRYVSCRNKECDDFGKKEEEREVVLEKEYATRIGSDIPHEVIESWTWTCPTCGLDSDFENEYDYN